MTAPRAAWIALLRVLPCLAAWGAALFPLPATAQTNLLRFGGLTGAPPFEFLDAAGQPAGLHIDLARAIARRLDAEAVLLLTNRAALDRAIRGGQIDLFAADQPSAEQSGRPLQPPLLQLRFHILSTEATGMFPTLESLQGHSVAVIRGSHAERQLRQRNPGAELLVVDSPRDAAAALQTGEASAALLAQPAAAYFLQNPPSNIRLQTSGPALFPVDHVFAAPSLATHHAPAQLDAAVRAALTDSEAAPLLARWLDPVARDRAPGPLVWIVLATAGAALLAGTIAFFATSARRGSERHAKELRHQLSERTRLADTLRENEERARSLIEHAPEAILVIDWRRRQLLEANEAAARLLELPRATVFDSAPFSQAPPVQPNGLPSQDLFEQQVRLALTGAVATFEWTVLTASGQSIPCEARLAKLPLRSAQILRASLIDNTARKQAEADEADRLAAAAEAARQKDLFLAHTGHELRIPLTAISGYAELLATESLTDAQRDYVKSLRASSRRMTRLVDELLDAAAVQAGAVTVRPQSINIRTLLAQACDPHAREARRKGIAFERVVDGDVPVDVVVDPDRLIQILANLLGNAIKFTAQGAVRLRVSVQRGAPATPPAAELQFTIDDSGPGVAPDAQDRLFQPFTRADPGYDRPLEGIGLGLAISRGIAEAMGGRLWFEAKSESGARFCFVVPLDRVPDALNAPSPADLALPASPRPEARARYRVLLAEDNASNAALFATLLQKLGCAVTIARDGDHALALVARDPFDALFLDIRLPNLDGLEVTRRIRAGDAGPDLVELWIIGLTAHVTELDRQLCFDAGMNDFLTKPCGLSDLLGALAKVPH